MGADLKLKTLGSGAMAGALAAGVALSAAAAGAAAYPPLAAGDEPVVVTQHVIKTARGPLAYEARAGRIPIRNAENGEVRAWVFFTAYVVRQRPGAKPRPLTFAWNGGPTGPSVLVQTELLGPRRIEGATFVDNAEKACSTPRTWCSWTRSRLAFRGRPSRSTTRSSCRRSATSPRPPSSSAPGGSSSPPISSRAVSVRRELRHLAGERGHRELLEKRGIKVAGAILLSGGVPGSLMMPLRVPGRLLHPGPHRGRPATAAPGSPT